MKTDIPLTPTEFQKKIQKIKQELDQKEKEKQWYEQTFINREYRTMEIATEVYKVMAKQNKSIKDVAKDIPMQYIALYRILNRKRLISSEEEEKVTQWLKKQ